MPNRWRRDERALIGASRFIVLFVDGAHPIFLFAPACLLRKAWRKVGAAVSPQGPAGGSGKADPSRVYGWVRTFRENARRPPPKRVLNFPVESGTQGVMLGRGAFILGSLMCACVVARADVLTQLPTADRVVALTFDACEAGERMSFDEAILDYLVERRIPFTVFASGKFVQSNVEDVRALGQLDFVDIENHSWNHPNHMHQFDPEGVLEQIGRAHDAIATATGRTPRFFRFPAGNYNADGVRAAESLGYTVVHWRWATGDPDPRESANALFRRVTRNVQPGDILIFHINGRGAHTAEALPRIVEQLSADGYRFALVSDYVGQPRVPPPPEQIVERIARRTLANFVTRAPLAALTRPMN
jgi:peptidoglycan/xylan/chitin deacetylase (PgdA/CDA1 family)